MFILSNISNRKYTLSDKDCVGISEGMVIDIDPATATSPQEFFFKLFIPKCSISICNYFGYDEFLERIRADVNGPYILFL